MIRKTNLLTAAALCGLAAAPVSAAMTASATTDLNLRAGPGPQYAVQSVIPAEGAVDVAGCLEAGEWCEVTYDGTSGWAYSAYLTTPVENEPVVIYQNTDRVKVETVTYDNTTEEAVGAASVGAWGAAVGSLIVGGPAAAAAGAVIGAAVGAESVPEETVTYVTANPVEPVYLNGEVVVGAGIPDTVTLYEVPDAQYQYVNVNEQYVVVNPENRRIVRVIR
ncbi:DUF1236 domain-containing protein [Litorisediminicola beolgyonensis]|uniref:DUF1236 domain-containing protein n=1 Tax=Litorisediminicola beolgyonensis TaxID=1173614 RepID=A0ABW3ZL93_9RHOB